MALQQLGPYRIVRKLGHGGMGTVYEGVHSETGESAALKVLAAPMAADEGFRERFEGEIEALRKLSHPNIVQLLGFGQQDGHLYYVMELVAGASLEDELKRGRRFDWPEVVRIGLDVSRALRHAHDRGVIHRDLKPGNLLITADGVVKLSDFGIARLFGQPRLTGAGSVLGTAEYMAPEQAGGPRIDVRCDLYSLGGVLYALLTGRPPFVGRSAREVLQLQQLAEPPAISQLAPATPPALQAIVGQLLCKDPESRPATALALGYRLQAVLDEAATAADTSPSGVAGGADRGPMPMVPQAAPPQSAAVADVPQLILPETSPMTAESRLPAEESGKAPDARSDAVAERQPAASKRFVPVGQERLEPSSEPQGYRVSTWLQTALLLVGLAAIVMLVWYALQPASADTLYGRIEAKVADPELLHTAEADISDFLARFPHDPRAATLRRYQLDIELAQREEHYQREADGLIGKRDQLPIERDYVDAIETQRFNPAQAAAKLQAIVALYQHYAGDSEQTARCLILVQRRCDRLARQTESEGRQRLDFLRRRLHEARELQARDPAGAREIYRAIVTLYSDKLWAAPAVQEAKKGLGIGDWGLEKAESARASSSIPAPNPQSPIPNP